MSILGIKRAGNTFFIIWWNFANNFFAKEKTAILRHKMCDTVQGYIRGWILKRFFEVIYGVGFVWGYDLGGKWISVYVQLL